MRSEYKEWVAQYNESQPISFYNGAIAAWEHQQSKVDELQKQLIDQGQRFNEQAQRVKDLEHKNGELQKQKSLQELEINQIAQANQQWQLKCGELQKRVDQQGLIIAKVMSIASDLQKSWAMFEIGKKLEQALKDGEA